MSLCLWHSVFQANKCIFFKKMSKWWCPKLKACYCPGLSESETWKAHPGTRRAISPAGLVLQSQGQQDKGLWCRGGSEGPAPQEEAPAPFCCLSLHWPESPEPLLTSTTKWLRWAWALTCDDCHTCHRCTSARHIHHFFFLPLVFHSIPQNKYLLHTWEMNPGPDT